MKDLLVVGGGPIGLATAIHARMAGLDVVIIEPRENTIDKACGEGLMPEAINLLNEMGVYPTGIDFFGIKYISGKRSIDARFSRGRGVGVRRTELYDALHQRAVQLGVQWHKAKVTDLNQHSDWIEAAGIKGRYLIAADGLHSSVRSILGLHVENTKLRRYGARQHFYHEPWSDLVDVHWLDGAELYVTPVSKEIVGIAVLGVRPLDFKAAIASVPEIAMRLKDAKAASELKGAGPLRQNTSARTKGRAILVGDASGYVDALTGEGLRIGLAQARAAVNAVVKHDPKSYEKEWLKITRSYRVLTGSLTWAAAHPPIRKLIVPAAQTLPWVFKKVVNSLQS
jgi:flavin-dependent dehydrogenase